MKNEKLMLWENNKNGSVYKELSLGDAHYLIIKYYENKTIRYKCKIWMHNRYKSLYLCNNPRLALDYIYNHFNEYGGLEYDLVEIEEFNSK